MSVSGRVIDQSGELLAGVSIILKGTSTGTTSDAEGRFKLTLPNESRNSRLVLSYIGYVTQELPVNSTVIDVTLLTDSKSLNEVVVVGYGEQERKYLSTAVASVSAKQIRDIPVATPAEAMVGKVAGITIQQAVGNPGTAPVIRVRGIGSLGASNSPLYVVDGYPLNSSDNFNQISPGDIESIQILKDAAAAAIYGSRGGNGIILVTTKRGKAGAPRFSFDTYQGVQQVTKKIDVLNAPQFVEYAKDAYKNGGAATANAYPKVFDDPSQWANTDWQDQIFRKARQASYQMSASGGSDRMNYYVSGGYLKQDGIVLGSNYERYNLRVNLDAQLARNVKIGVNLAPSFTNTNQVPSFGTFNVGYVGTTTDQNASVLIPGGAVSVAASEYPIIPVRLPNGDFGQTNNFADLGTNPYVNSFIPSPVAAFTLNKDKVAAARAISNVYLSWELLKGLTVKTNFGVEFLFNRRDTYLPAALGGNATVSSPILNNITARQYNANNYNWVWENTLTYNKTFANDHNFVVLAGYAAQNNVNEGGISSGQANTYTNTLLTYVTAAGQIFGQNTYTANALISSFGRVNYSYKDKYLFSAAVRSDGSSRFGTNNRFATFPSASVAWRMTEERFMKRLPSVSELKLRASYGVTGNYNVGDFATQSYMLADNAVFGSGTGTASRVFGFSPSTLANKNLTWETNKQVDIGVELGLFSDRLYVTADVYQRNTTGLLTQKNVPAVVGYSTSILDNIGEVRNRGLELSVSSQNTTGAFTWSTNANISFNQNQVISLVNSNFVALDPVFGWFGTVRVTPGDALGSFYGYQQLGVYKNQADVDANPKWSAGGNLPGDIKYKDVNGDGTINANDYTYLGNPLPTFIYGLTNTVKYKNFDLNIILQGTQGNKILNGTDRYYTNFGGRTNARTIVLDRWRSENDPGNGMQPRVTLGATNGGNQFSSRNVHDGSFLRIRTVTLGYTIPSSVVEKIKLKTARLYFSGQNLYTFTKYFGYNPEVNNGGDSTLPIYGVDQGAYPVARNLTIGLNIGF